MLVMIPFWTSYLVKTFAWMITLDQNGVMNRLLLGGGIIDAPLEVLHGRIGVMIGMVHAMLPLAVLTMLPVMIGHDRHLPRAAGTLGAPPGQVFWRVYFHLSLPGVAAAGLLVFITSLGFFITPALLGGPKETMLAQLIISQVTEMMNWSFAGALSVMMLAAALVTTWVYDRLFGLSTVSGQAAGRSGTGSMRAVVGVAILSGPARRACGRRRHARLVGRRLRAAAAGHCGCRVPFSYCRPCSSSRSPSPPAISSPSRRRVTGWAGSGLFRLRSLDRRNDPFLRGGLRDGPRGDAIGGFAALALAQSESRWGGRSSRCSWRR